MQGAEQEVHDHEQAPSRGPGRIYHRLELFWVPRGRLLNQHVLPTLERLQRHGLVQVVREDEIEQVDARIVE